MLVQLNRNNGARDFSATATGLPLNPAMLPASTGPRPVVAVLGPRGRVTGLAHHLPSGWSVRYADDLDDVTADELLLFVGPAVADIALARRLLPSRTQLVALVDDTAPGEAVAAVLTAGADACVRVACRRRQLAGRWARLDEQGRVQ
jgi:hypothetical protein